VLSDVSGLATLQPSSGAAQGAIVIQGTSAAGASVLPFRLQSLAAVVPAASGAARPAGSGPTEKPELKE
jgi:hypothetical protein